MSDFQSDQELLPRASFWHSIKMVSCAFLGIRKSNRLQEDTVQVNPLHIIAVGIGLAVTFVFVLIVLVQWVAG